MGWKRDKRLRSVIKTTRSNQQFSRLLGIAVVIVFAGLGTYLLTTSHAASPYANSEAEAGTLGSGASLVSDANASSGTAVKFSSGITGTANCPGLTNAAFCDNFNNPTSNPPNVRAAALNGAVWGVSRQTGAENLGSLINQWTSPTLTGSCGSMALVNPPNDVEICNGQLHETTDDGGTVTTLAMYPKQPFDFAGRTGKVVFDVSNDSQANHAAWPEFWMSDQPVPTPFTHEQSYQSLPRNGFGIRFAGCASGTCSQGSTSGCGGGVGVDSAITIANYVGNDSFNAGSIQVIDQGSVKESCAGQMNHYEIDVSQNDIEVYATNPFTGNWNPATNPLVHISSIPNANLNFTRGLIWIEDDHYNAGKFNAQRNHTFNWDNVGFDGPVLPRDLTFDAPDNHSATTNADGEPAENLGYFVPSSGSSATLTIPGVTGLSSASSAVLLFGFYDQGPVPFTFNYSINGHQHSSAWPFPGSLPDFSPHTLAISTPLSDIQSGTNTVTFSGSGTAYHVFNIDILLPGAGGVVQPTTPID